MAGGTVRWTRTWPAVVAVAALAGCAAQRPETALREGPRMLDLYRGTAGAAEAAAAAGAAAASDGAMCRWWLFAWPCPLPEPGKAESPSEDAAPWARTAANELAFLFPRLPNPDVYLYVFPHLATESRVPVPGYTTAVPLYKRVEYALPGEIPGTEAPDAPARATPDAGPAP